MGLDAVLQKEAEHCGVDLGVFTVPPLAFSVELSIKLRMQGHAAIPNMCRKRSSSEIERNSALGRENGLGPVTGDNKCFSYGFCRFSVPNATTI